MRTNFTSEQLADPHAREAEKALRTCIHCGFCTATCPTYLLLGDERDGPRGRIVLMQTMLESGAPPTAETVKHLDRCLSCLGCRTTCPSGVDYSALIDAARLHIAKTYRRPWTERLFRSFVLFVLMRPGLFKLSSRLARVLAPRLPGRLGSMAKQAARLKRRSRPAMAAAPQADGAREIVLLQGCVQKALAPEIDAAAARVLSRAGITTKPLSACCGALAYHMGRDDIAMREGRRIITAFERSGAEACLITASGCAAFLKDYGRIFARERAWAPRAHRFADKVKDFTELAPPMIEPASHVRGLTVAYHPPCSLQHGQRRVGVGERLLAAAGFWLASFPDVHLCCGSAGSYSVLQPDIAAELRARKLAAIRSSGADCLASANIGCLVHLSGELPTVHIAELLDWAQGGPKPL